MLPYLIFMVEFTHYIHGGVHHECEKREHYFTILWEYLRIFRVKEKFKAMWYGIVTNSHIAFNYIHIKFWVVYDAMVLDMKTNLLINFDMLLQLIQKFTISWNKLFVCLYIAGVFFFFKIQMHESCRSIISIKMIISSDIDKQLRY